LSSHTDSKGTDLYNLDLSNRRAASCVEYLITKGIPSSRMRSKGYGESMPIAPNTFPDGKDNPDGRTLNRRTEFKVIN
ncbi:MAG: OmpA family protein, partial [Chryseobacterium sp.]